MSKLANILNAEGPLAKALSWVVAIMGLALVIAILAWLDYLDEFRYYFNVTLDFFKSLAFW